MVAAYEDVIGLQNGQFCLDSDYPYTGFDGECKFGRFSHFGSISKYVNIVEDDEDDLASKVEQYGPVASAIDASTYSFKLYSGGKYDELKCSPRNLDHGFGNEDGKKYWIVRNSWGTDWG